MSANRVINVMTRTPQPRTAIEIAWHLPDMSIAEVQRSLDAMNQAADVVRIVGSDAIPRYYLVLHDKRIRNGDYPEPVIAIVLGLALIAAAIIGGIGVVFLGKLVWAMLKAAL